MSGDERLPLDLTWQADGHATDVALSMVADGAEALLPEGVLGHLEGCEACSARLGGAALLSLRATEELPAIAAKLAVPARVAAPVTRPIPVRVLAAALAVAVLGAIPSFMTGMPKVLDVTRSALRMLPVLGRAAFSLLGGSAGRSGISPALSVFAALLFLLVGIALARSMPARDQLKEA